MPIIKTENGEMNVNVDWLSVSIPRTQIYSWVVKDETGTVKRMYEARERKMFNLISGSPDLKESGGRAPFNRSYHSKAWGFTVFESDRLPYSLVEFTGTGCEKLRDFGWLEGVIADWKDRLTRIDLACDIATDINPITFMRGRNETKFTSESQVVSESGITCYVGSKVSDRYTRVYRYNPPHPRSDLLRIEFVLKSDYARKSAEIFVDTPLHELVKGLFNTFGWEDFGSLIAGNGVSLLSTPKENHQGKTERWLLTQVLPALQRLSESGNVEFITFFQERLDEIRKGS